MARPDNFFSEIAGVPIHYARPPIAPYGTRGKSYSFYTTAAFEKKLTICFEELWATCPLGAAAIVTSAGTWVDKSGYHGLGRAIDVDGILLHSIIPPIRCFILELKPSSESTLVLF
jgi:hypothetical protein